MEQLAALASEGGIGDGLRSFDDVSAPVSECPADDFWRAAIADEMRDGRALPWRLAHPRPTKLVSSSAGMPTSLSEIAKRFSRSHGSWPDSCSGRS